MAPVYAETIRQAAQGELIHNDDTTARILDLMGMRRAKALAKGELDNEDRTGIFTSGILSVTEVHKLAVFFTGTQHAGENLTDLLANRDEELGAPIQMCDALSRNLPSEEPPDPPAPSGRLTAPGVTGPGPPGAYLSRFHPCFLAGGSAKGKCLW